MCAKCVEEKKRGVRSSLADKSTKVLAFDASNWSNTRPSAMARKINGEDRGRKKKERKGAKEEKWMCIKETNTISKK